MGFNSIDAHNLNKSKDMFGSIGISTGATDELLTIFPISSFNPGENAADVLSEGLKSAMRFDQSMNVWIDVQTPQIPEFVVQAIQRCRGFPLRLVVTHGPACSHEPGDALPKDLMTAIAQASATQAVWHPIAKRLTRPLCA